MNTKKVFGRILIGFGILIVIASGTLCEASWFGLESPGINYDPYCLGGFGFTGIIVLLFGILVLKSTR